MSDEGREFVKRFSPYRGLTFWLHYVLGDLANAQHGYLIYISDATLAKEWPVFTRGTISRSRQQILKDRYLTPVDVGGGPDKPRVYRFEFVGAEDMRREVRNPRAHRAGSKGTRAITDSTRATMTREPARSVVPARHGTELETEETEGPAENLVQIDRIRELLKSGPSSNEAVAL